MPGSLTLVTGQVTSRRDLSADDGKLRSTVRNAAVEFGYNSVSESNDAQNDPFKQVNDWMVTYLARHVKQASDGHRVNAEAERARDAEQDVIDNEQ